MSEEAATIFGLSAGFGIFIIFLGILWFLLCVILFFKIWVMTNDVREIKNMFKEQLDLEHPYVEENESTKDRAT
jgi:hypothetical protein